ncbi:MAG: acetyl-CoA carboxylase biotin carboxyl carrier protein [Oscillospiraceae bacterium]|nr:acetyl-CoA carboxylase biotin carboxyl carrier protein [Oscillospiraceae bacterium]
MNIDAIRALAEIARDYGLTVLEAEGERVYLERGAPPPPETAVSRSPEGASAAPADAGDETASGTPVRAPLVGVFYTAPAPGKPPFVQTGDRVKKGDTLCIIEAMKLMNEIPAERDGEVCEVCVQNGQVVEYGQVLFRLI